MYARGRLERAAALLLAALAFTAASARAALPEPWLAAETGAPGGLSADAGARAVHPGLAEAGGGLYAVWEDGGLIRAAAYSGDDAAPAWSAIDGGGLNRDRARRAEFPSAAGLGGVLFVAWHEHDGAAWQARVAAYDGSWSFADGGGASGLNRSPRLNALHPRLAAFGGRLYAAWQESDGAARRVRVAVRGGGGAWSSVDGGGLFREPGKDALAPRLAVHAGRLYAAWHEDNGSARQARVAVYNGDDAAPAWRLVDGGSTAGLGGDPARHSLFPSLASAGGVLYAAWYQLTEGPRRVRVAAYNGDDAAPAWTLIDGGSLNRDPSANALFPRLLSFQSRLYAAWQDWENGAKRVRVAVYNGPGASPAWSLADGGGTQGLALDPGREGSFPVLGLFQDGLHAAWTESSGETSWVRSARYKAAPAAPGVSEVSTHSVTLSWLGSGPSLGYLLEASTSPGFGGTLLRAETASRGAAALAVAGLSPATLYHLRLGARYPGETLYAAALSTATALPVVAAGTLALDGAALGVSSIAWSWQAADNADYYEILSDTGGLLSPRLGAEARSWTETGASPNARLSRALAAGNSSSRQVSAPRARHALAAAPAAPAAADIIASGLRLRWEHGGNPDSTLYEVQWTSGAAFASVGAATGTSRALALAPCADYSLRARAVNGDGAASPWSSVVTARTSDSLPVPAESLSAAPMDGNRIFLSWAAPVDPERQAFRLYEGSAFQSLGPMATAFATAALEDGEHRFELRSVSRCGVEQEGGARASARAMALASPARAALDKPEPGLKLSGDRVELRARLLFGDSPREVRFQYRSSAGLWRDVPACDPAAPNPAREEPYWTCWDLSDPAAVPDGAYALRAVAVAASGEADSWAPETAAYVDRLDPDIEERELGLDWYRSRRRCANEAGSTLSATEPGDGLLTSVTLPAGALDTSTAVLRVEINPPFVPAARNLESAGVFREIALETGQTRLRQVATLVLEYPDKDGDGFVDGAGIKADRLKAYSFDPASGEWTRDFESEVEQARRAVVARTPHFTLFGLFAPLAADLSSVRVYPVPYVPGDGADDNGKPFSAGDPASGILFDNLTADASVEVYSVTGERVWSGANPGAGGALRWDARNSAGRDAASGVYYAVIKSGSTGERVVRRLAIVR